jgi:tRNA modification GTPase
VGALEHFEPDRTDFILNKIDLSISVSLKAILPVKFSKCKIFETSTILDSSFITLFESHIKERIGQMDAGQSSPVITNERQLLHARNALDHLCKFLASQDDVVLAAEQLRQAANCVGRITGHIDSEDVLNVLFSTFCIGK